MGEKDELQLKDVSCLVHSDMHFKFPIRHCLLTT